MEFEWNEQKNQSTLFKHGISFQEVKEVFKDPNLLTFIDDRVNYEEIRKLSIDGYCYLSSWLL